MKKWLLILLLAAPLHAATTYTTTVYTTTPTWNTTLFADVTTQFQVSVTTYSYFQNQWFVTLKAINQVTCGGSQPCQLDQDIAAMIANSTYNYVYGWADSAQHQEYTDLGLAGGIWQDCYNASTSTFLVVGSSWVYDTNISSMSCEEAVNAVDNMIYQQQLSGPTTGIFYP